MDWFRTWRPGWSAIKCRPQNGTSKTPGQHIGKLQGASRIMPRINRALADNREVETCRRPNAIVIATEADGNKLARRQSQPLLHRAVTPRSADGPQ